MHPIRVRSFVRARVDELRLRLATRPDLGSVDVDVEWDLPELFIAFDHREFETQTVRAGSGLHLPGGAQAVQLARVPVIGGSHRTRRLVLHMQLDAYDLLAPTGALLDDSRVPLQSGQWPTSFAAGGIIDSHPVYGRPFFCRPGLREYHDHPQHEDEPWAKWRDTLLLHTTVLGLLEDLHVRWYGAA